MKKEMRYVYNTTINQWIAIDKTHKSFINAIPEKKYNGFCRYEKTMNSCLPYYQTKEI